MSRPRLLDLCCGAGGCSAGYDEAGFQVVGWDIEWHADYPFQDQFVEGDALHALQDLDYLNTFQVVHASPPCPRYSTATRAAGNPEDHPDLVGPFREALKAWGGIYVMENVPGAPLENPLLLCGQALGMKGIKRHRLFESNAPVMSPGCGCDSKPVATITGATGEDRRREPNGARTGGTRHGRLRYPGLSVEEAADLLGVPWMSRREDVNDAIPPTYTQYLGLQLLDYLDRTAAL